MRPTERVSVHALEAAIERLDDRLNRADAAAAEARNQGQDDRRVTVRISRGFGRLLRLVLVQALATEQELQS